MHDPDGDAVTWDLAVDGVTIGSGTEADSPWSIQQTYDTPGDRTAVLTATDGVNTVRQEMTVTITEAQPAA